MNDSAHPSRGVLVRDAVVFQGKLLLDGLRDILLVPISIAAAIVSWLHAGRGAGGAFYDIVRLGRRSERWIDLFAAARRVAPEAEAGRDPTLDELLERVERGLVDQYRRTGGRIGVAQVHEAIEHVKRRIVASRRGRRATAESVEAGPETLRPYIRDVADFPEPGILFKDITPLLADQSAFGRSIDELLPRVAAHRPQGIVAIESRGFIFGAVLAARLGLPLYLVRKPGKLPSKTLSIRYALEYGSGELQIHADSIHPGQRCAIVDDVMATGGTAAATAELIGKLGGQVACFAFVIELTFLAGRPRLGNVPVEALLRYDTD